MKLILVVVIVILISSVSLAQEDACQGVVRTAFNAIQSYCAQTNRNQVCYGNNTLVAEPRSNAPVFEFDSPGDIADIGDLNSLRLSSFDAPSRQWGVALMKIQANLPGTLPGQNVTLLMFGDVELQNAAPRPHEPIVLQGTTKYNLMVFNRPSSEAQLITSLPVGKSVLLDGRNQPGNWLKIRFEDYNLTEF